LKSYFILIYARKLALVATGDIRVIVDNDAGNVYKTDDQERGVSEPSSLSDRAFDYIRRSIFDGRFGPGDKINELDISQRLGISRGPVREAIRRMSSSGLLTFEPNSGARVVSVSSDKVEQLYDVREVLEAKAAALAAIRMTDEERMTLTQTLDAHLVQMTEDNSNTYPRGGSDWDFHLLILKGARNDVIWRICGDELKDMFNLLRSQHGSSPGRGRKALEEHRWVAEAIVSGNVDLAALLMAQHIRASRNNLLAVMRASPQHTKSSTSR
jgi:DNA-binding GntR family transcriptional regulator